MRREGVAEGVLRVRYRGGIAMVLKCAKIAVIFAAVLVVFLSVTGMTAVVCADRPSMVVVHDVDVESLGSTPFQGADVAIADIPVPQSPDQEPKSMIAFLWRMTPSSI